ncbi:MAG: DCC1-like thiol-disulfide oxidoreductase family protein [Myxococcaceae bacterium]
MDDFSLIRYQEAPSHPVYEERRQACARAMHVYTADGRWLRAGRASLFVLERMGPGWRLFARIMGIPPLRWAVELGYWIIARNRRQFAPTIIRRLKR